MAAGLRARLASLRVSRRRRRRRSLDYQRCESTCGRATRRFPGLVALRRFGPGPERGRRCVRGHEPAFQKLALYYLTSDSASLSTLREALPIHADTLAFTKLSSALGNTANALSEPVPTLPSGLLRKYFDPCSRPLIPSWLRWRAIPCHFCRAGWARPAVIILRPQPADAETWDKRVYQAIAQLDDDAQVPVLEKIYAGARSGSSSKHGDTSIIKDLYWTIRGMDGPNARRLPQHGSVARLACLSSAAKSLRRHRFKSAIQTSV